MPTKNIHQLIANLSFEKKLVGTGSLLMVISLFLPWYQDRDSFGTGDMFLGITGPLYLIGFSLLVMAGINLASLFMESAEKKLPFLHVKRATFYLTSGTMAFYMLMVINSIYFHQKFGLNITIKESQFGMFFALIAASLMTIGGYLATREKKALLKEFQEEAEQTLIKIPDQAEMRKPKENLRNTEEKFQADKQQALKPIQRQMDHIDRIAVGPMADSSNNAEANSNYQPFRTDL